MLVVVFRFSTEKSFKTSESTCFSKKKKKKKKKRKKKKKKKKNTSNELNIFFLNKIEEDLFR